MTWHGDAITPYHKHCNPVSPLESKGIRVDFCVAVNLLLTCSGIIEYSSFSENCQSLWQMVIQLLLSGKSVTSLMSVELLLLDQLLPRFDNWQNITLLFLLFPIRGYKYNKTFSLPNPKSNCTFGYWVSRLRGSSGWHFRKKTFQKPLFWFQNTSHLSWGPIREQCKTVSTIDVPVETIERIIDDLYLRSLSTQSRILGFCSYYWDYSTLTSRWQ